MSEKEARPKFADRVVALAEERVAFYHSPDGTAFADVEIDGVRNTHRVRSAPFRQFLARAVYAEARTVPPADAINAALGVLEAKARYDGAVRPVFLRVGGHAGKIYLDLADEKWRAVEIDEDGWRIVDRPPVRFRRSAGMLPLPAPVRGLGGVERLRPLLNLEGADDSDGSGWTLAIAWLLAALRDRGPYPLLVLNAEQGSGKSLASRMLRGLIDPNAAPLRNLPREERDVFISASNGHILAFDNVSSLQPWQSDAICRLSTGGGAAYRRLYEDSEEAIFEAQRPIILNGISDFLTRADAADRAIVLDLRAIPEDKRRPESEIMAAYEAARPAILCDLLDKVVEGLANLPTTRLASLPRMADFALWGTACEGGTGALMIAYDINRAEAIETVIAADPVAAYIDATVNETTPWAGTAGQLLAEIEHKASAGEKSSRAFPKTPKAVREALKRSAPFLRKRGFAINYDRVSRARIITIERTSAPRKVGATPSQPSSPSPPAIINGSRNDGYDDDDGCGPTSRADCLRCGGEGCGWCGEVTAGALA